MCITGSRKQLLQSRRKAAGHEQQILFGPLNGMEERMQAFLKPLKELAEYEEICRILKKNQGILQVSGCMESQKAHLIGGLSAFFSMPSSDRRR